MRGARTKSFQPRVWPSGDDESAVSSRPLRKAPHKFIPRKLRKPQAMRRSAVAKALEKNGGEAHLGKEADGRRPATRCCVYVPRGSPSGATEVFSLEAELQHTIASEP